MVVSQSLAALTENKALPWQDVLEMRTVKQTASIIRYTNLIHEYGLGSQQVEDFKKNHSDDAAFLSRAKKLDNLFALVNEDDVEE